MDRLQVLCQSKWPDYWGVCKHRGNGNCDLQDATGILQQLPLPKVAPGNARLSAGAVNFAVITFKIRSVWKNQPRL
jgi:hypothetical protein